MTDPHDALKSFQRALKSKSLRLQKCTLDDQMFLHAEERNGVPRFTYVIIDKDVVTSFAMFAVVEPINGTPCFQVGYAVPMAYRNQGRARKIVDAALAEMKLGFAKAQVKSFYVEAVVGKDNEASKCVASTTISATAEEIIDKVSGLPAVRYLREVKISD